MRYFYAYGYKTFAAAEAALLDGYASGELLPGELPLIESYTARSGKRRYGITVRES